MANEAEDQIYRRLEKPFSLKTKFLIRDGNWNLLIVLLGKGKIIYAQLDFKELSNYVVCESEIIELKKRARILANLILLRLKDGDSKL